MSFMQESSIFVKCVHCVAKVKNPDDVILKEISSILLVGYVQWASITSLSFVFVV